MNMRDATWLCKDRTALLIAIPARKYLPSGYASKTSCLQAQGAMLFNDVR